MENCPCGSGKKYSECCEPIIKGTALAPTAEVLMRARYTAYVQQEIDFIIDSCEKSDEIAEIDRKATEDWSKTSTWHGLKILRTEKGLENDTEGLVEFEATYTRKQIRDVYHETGYFKKIDGKIITFFTESIFSGNFRGLRGNRSGLFQNEGEDRCLSPLCLQFQESGL